jgi:hypothetical protein
MKFRCGIYALSKKAVENGSRCRSIEAAIMKTQANFGMLGH